MQDFITNAITGKSLKSTLQRFQNFHLLKQVAD